MIRANNPHLKFTNDQRGYILCDLGRDAWKTDLKVLGAVSRPDAPFATRASFVIERGKAAVNPA